MSDNMFELMGLIQEIFTDPIWRGSRLPSEDIELRTRSVIEKIQIEQEVYMDTIREQQDQISRLARALHKERYGFE